MRTTQLFIERGLQSLYCGLWNSRSYDKQENFETTSATYYTHKYAAPEVVEQPILLRHLFFGLRSCGDVNDAGRIPPEG